MLLDNFFFGDDEGSWSDLRRKVDASSDGSQTSCDFVDLLELRVDCLEMFSRTWEGLLKRKWIWSNGDALGLSRESWQFLVKFLTDERHHRMETPQSMLKTSEKSECCQLFLFFAATCKDRLRSFKINIT